jgi:hypothetical protein
MHLCRTPLSTADFQRRGSKDGQQEDRPIPAEPDAEDCGNNGFAHEREMAPSSQHARILPTQHPLRISTFQSRRIEPREMVLLHHKFSLRDIRPNLQRFPRSRGISSLKRTTRIRSREATDRTSRTAASLLQHRGQSQQQLFRGHEDGVSASESKSRRQRHPHKQLTWDEEEWVAG